MSEQPIRVNARFAGEDARRVRLVRKLEKQSTSALLRAAVREYTDKRLKPRKSAYEIMLESGFIGCAEGPADLSTNTRKYMQEALKKKYPQHFKSRKS